MTADQFAPTSAKTRVRIDTLDIIRGVAVMGILVMNIVAFGMPEAAYMNPAAFGGHTGIDLAVWAFNFVLVDGKMRGLFSFLFGASLLLVIEAATAKGESGGRVHYARMFWLLLFGLAHLILLWWGDILNNYALMGAIAFLFRKKSPKTLVIVAICLVLFELLLVASLPLGYQFAKAAAEAPGATAEQIKAFKGFSEGFGVPTAEALAKDLALHRGPWIELVQHRLGKAGQSVFGGVLFYGAETLAYMLFGMAGYKSGMLTGAWSRRAYWRWVAIGFGIGIPVSAAIAWTIWSSGFAVFDVMLGAITLTTPVRPLMIMGWASLIVLCVGSGGWLATRLAATGRMAFSNYLGTSMICSTIFYGQGFALYGHLSRAELYIVVAGVWVLMLAWSKPWLARFRYGPLEWLWRSLARGRVQAIRGPAA